jgi:hypothetical protein
MRKNSHNARHGDAQAPPKDTYVRAHEVHPPWDDYWVQRRADSVAEFIEQYGVTACKPGERSAAGMRAYRQWKKQASRKRRQQLRRIRCFALTRGIVK